MLNILMHLKSTSCHVILTVQLKGNLILEGSKLVCPLEVSCLLVVTMQECYSINLYP